jgi:hypothetical protein
MVSVYWLAAVGVPESAPFAASVSPPGSVPAANGTHV